MDKTVTKIRKLYLAHPLLSRHRVRRWELKIEKDFNLELENPFYDKNGPGGRDDTLARDNFKEIKKTPGYDERLVQNDLRLLGGCDGVLAIVDGATSYGTIMEIVHGNILRKPVFIICCNGYEFHPWLKIYSEKIFKSVEEFLEFVQGDERFK